MKKAFPKSFYFVLGNEFAERFSYYGYRALLTPFLVIAFAMSNEEAAAVTHSNIVLTYATPVLGALIADWFLGKYRTILWVSLLYCVGHGLLAIYIDDLVGFRVGLFVIALGAGILKPNSSALLGDQFKQHSSEALTRAFNWYYFSINLGSFLAMVFIPELKAFGYEVAFAIPGVLMGVATVVLFLGRKTYVLVPAGGYPRNNFLTVNLAALKARLQGEKQVWKSLEQKWGAESVDGVRATWRIMGFFAFIPIAWGSYELSGAEWVLDAAQLDRTIWGFELEQEQVQAFNPILILTLIPVLLGVFKWLEKKNIEVKATRKILVGFVLIGIATALEGMIKLDISRGLNPHVSWQLLAYFVLTLGELLVSITGLEMGYRYSPAKMKSTITSVWLLALAMGNLVAVWVNNAIEAGGSAAILKEGANFYWFFVGLLAVNTVLYLLIVPRIKLRDYVVGEEM